MQYKNIFFDLDDTLWAFSFNARDTFEEMYRKYEYDRYFRSFEHFYELYERRNIELWAEYADGKVTKEELNRQRFLYPLEAVGEGDTALAKAFSDDFFAVIPTKSRTVIFYVFCSTHLYLATIKLCCKNTLRLLSKMSIVNICIFIQSRQEEKR